MPAMQTHNPRLTIGCDHQYTDPTGAHIQYRCQGHPQGRALLYFHGWPGSRLEADLMKDLAFTHGWMLIAPDRPGYGGSFSPRPLSLNDWALLVERLIAYLGLERFSLIGLSGGGPHACVVMAKLSNQLDRACLVVPMGPLHCKDGFMKLHPFQRILARLTPSQSWLVRGVLHSIRPLPYYGPSLFLRLMAQGLLPEADRKVLDVPELRPLLCANMREGLSRGIEGMWQDGLRFVEDWNDLLASISCPVKIWHGYEDTIVPIEFGQHLATSIPSAEACWLEGEGHFSIPLQHASSCFTFLDE